MKLRERERSGKITPSKRQMKDTITDTPTEREVQTVWKQVPTTISILQ